MIRQRVRMPSAGLNRPPPPAAASGGWRGRWCSNLRRLRQSAAEEGPPGPDERIAIPDYFPDERKRPSAASVRTRGRLPPAGWMGR